MSAQNQNLVASFLCTLFGWVGWISTRFFLKQFKLNIQVLFLSEIWDKTALLLTASTNFHFGMHSNVFESIRFRLGLRIDTIFRLVCLIDLNIDWRSQECEKSKYSRDLPKFSIDLDEIWFTFLACLCDEPLTYHISFIQCSRERTHTTWRLLVACLLNVPATCYCISGRDLPRIFLIYFFSWHTEIEVADQTLYLTQSQHTGTGPVSPSADPITPGAGQGSGWSTNF